MKTKTVNRKTEFLWLIAFLPVYLMQVATADELCLDEADTATNVRLCEAKNLGINAYSLSRPLRAGTYCMKISKPSQEQLVGFAHRDMQSATNMSVFQTYSANKCQLAVLEVPGCTTTLSFTRANNRQAGDCLFVAGEIKITALYGTAACACDYQPSDRTKTKKRRKGIDKKFRRSLKKTTSLYPEIHWKSGSSGITPAIKKSLKRLAQWLNTHPEIQKLGIASVSFRAPDHRIINFKKRKKLDNARFRAVSKYLAKAGVDTARLRQLRSKLWATSTRKSGGSIHIKVMARTDPVYKPRGIEVKLQQSFEKVTSLYPEISWKSGGSRVSAAIEAPLKRLAQWLIRHPEILKFGITGVSSADGDPNENKIHADARFGAVFNYLVELGVAGHRLTQAPDESQATDLRRSGGSITIRVLERRAF